MARPLSPRVFEAMRMIADGVNPYRAAVSVVYPQNTIYKILARYNDRAETAQEKAKLFLAEHAPQDTLDGIN